MKRSDTTILVKNLPHSAAENTLRSLFGRCGPTLRIVLPPSKVIALVEFEQPSHAKYVYFLVKFASQSRTFDFVFLLLLLCCVFPDGLLSL